MWRWLFVFIFCLFFPSYFSNVMCWWKIMCGTCELQNLVVGVTPLISINSLLLINNALFHSMLENINASVEVVNGKLLSENVPYSCCFTNEA